MASLKIAEIVTHAHVKLLLQSGACMVLCACAASALIAYKLISYFARQYKCTLTALHSISRLTSSVHVEEKDYYITKDEINIRPYGMLFKEV